MTATTDENFPLILTGMTMRIRFYVKTVCPWAIQRDTHLSVGLGATQMGQVFHSTVLTKRQF